LSKEERAKLALQRRQEQVAAQKSLLQERRVSQHQHQEELSGHSDRRRRDGGGEGREKQREATLLQKDREKEVEAIKVGGCVMDIGRFGTLSCSSSHDTWELTKNAGKCAG
jgi:hypothetical protein